jgi:hypothetical protein
VIPGPPCAVSSFTTPRKTSTYTRGSAAAVAAVLLAATATPLLLVTLHPLFASTAKLSSASLLSGSRPFGHVFGHALCMAEAEMGQDARAAVEPQPWPAVAAALVASGASAPLQQMHDLSDPSRSCVQVVSISHGFVFMRGASSTVSASAALAAPTIEMHQAALPARAAGRPQRTPMASIPDACATTTEAELVRRRMPELLGVASPRAARHGKRCLPAPLFCFPGVSSGRPRRTP